MLPRSEVELVVLCTIGPIWVEPGGFCLVSSLVFPGKMNLLLIPSLLVDMNSVMNSPVCWQDDDKFCFWECRLSSGSLFPTVLSVDVSAVVVQVTIGGDLLSYQIYLACFAPVAPSSSFAAG